MSSIPEQLFFGQKLLPWKKIPPSCLLRNLICQRYIPICHARFPKFIFCLYSVHFCIFVVSLSNLLLFITTNRIIAKTFHWKCQKLIEKIYYQNYPIRIKLTISFHSFYIFESQEIDRNGNTFSLQNSYFLLF